MGFKDYLDESALKTEGKKWGFRILSNRRNRIYAGLTGPCTLTGAVAEVIDQTQTSRTTATRVALGTAIAPGVGTVLGAMAKKNSSNIVIRITCTDGVLFSETKSTDRVGAERFCAKFNQRFASGVAQDEATE